MSPCFLDREELAAGASLDQDESSDPCNTERLNQVWQEGSVNPQSDHRVNARSSPRWIPARHNGDYEQDDWYNRERRHVIRAHTVEHAGRQLGSNKGNRQPQS